ncbi:MAG: hypothetical protein JO363_09190, partial [Solirubrobacterales bacterium]|nr:hypothetical protein [Solirubrobacterales bacterium]
MKPNDADRELARLQEANERVGANLVELEIDSSRQLLEAAPLTGESAARWSVASTALTDLWEWRGLLEKLLERAEELRRSPRRASELEALISGPSIELARAQVPLAERKLLGSSEVTVRCTADELLARMSQAFNEVGSVVAQFGQAWDTLTPRLTAARGVFDRARALADSLGESGRTGLEDAADRLTRLTGTLAADPLSVEPMDVDRLSESLEAIRRELEAANALRGELDAKVANARRLLTELQRVVDEGRAAHEELLMKIAASSAPPTLELPSNLEGELGQIAAVARAGGWRDAHRRLHQWTADTRALLDDAQRILRANRAPIEARNQLRALLEAYQVK